MPFYRYPNADDIEVVLKSNAIWPADDSNNPGEPTPAQLLGRRQAYIVAEGAKDQFENLTGWGPTLAVRDEQNQLVVETRYFDGGDHNGDLVLQGGLLRLDSIAISGTVQTEDFTPYFQRFTRRPDSPIIALRGCFFGNRGGVYGMGYGRRGNAIAITGVWGKFLQLPGDVFEVCQHKAIANMMDYVLNEQSIGSLSRDGFSKSLDITGVRTQQNIAETGAKGFNDLCSQHKRPYLG